MTDKRLGVNDEMGVHSHSCARTSLRHTQIACAVGASPGPTVRDMYKRLAAARPFFLFAGPNVIESRDHCLRMANAIAAVAERLQLGKQVPHMKRDSPGNSETSRLNAKAYFQPHDVTQSTGRPALDTIS